MEIDEAMKRAVRSYYENADFTEYEKTAGKIKHSKDFFDRTEEDIRKGKKSKTPKKEKYLKGKKEGDLVIEEEVDA